MDGKTGVGVGLVFEFEGMGYEEWGFFYEELFSG